MLKNLLAPGERVRKPSLGYHAVRVRLLREQKQRAPLACENFIECHRGLTEEKVDVIKRIIVSSWRNIMCGDKNTDAFDE